MDELLRRQQVEQITALSRSTIYNLVAEGRFPKPRRCGSRAVRWSRADVQQWIEATAIGRVDSIVYRHKPEA